MDRQEQHVWDILAELGIDPDGFTRGHPYELVTFKPEKETISYTKSFIFDFWLHDGKECNDPEKGFKTFLITEASFFIEVSYLQGIARIDVYPDCNLKKLRSALRRLVRQGFNHVKYPWLEIRQDREYDDFDLRVYGARKFTTIYFGSKWGKTGKDNIKKVLLEFLNGDYHINSKKFAKRYAYQRSLPPETIKIYFPCSSWGPDDYEIFVVINRVCDLNKLKSFLKAKIK